MIKLTQEQYQTEFPIWLERWELRCKAEGWNPFANTKVMRQREFLFWDGVQSVVGTQAGIAIFLMSGRSVYQDYVRREQEQRITESEALDREDK